MDDITPIRKPEIIGEAGGLVDESRLTLGIHGEDLDPDEIARVCSDVVSSSRRCASFRTNVDEGRVATICRGEIPDRT